MFHVIQAQTVQPGYVVIVKGVVDLAAILAAAHEVKLAQAAQLMRNGRFGHVEVCSEISDIQFPFEKEGDDPQARWVAEGAEQVSKMGESIFLNKHKII